MNKNKEFFTLMEGLVVGAIIVASACTIVSGDFLTASLTPDDYKVKTVSSQEILLEDPSAEDTQLVTVFVSPTIEVTPVSLDFSNVIINTHRDMTFTVKNTGGGILRGKVAGLTAPLSCYAGCSYSLTAGASQIVTIRFAPIVDGRITRIAVFSGDREREISRSVSGKGIAPPTPAINVIPPSRDFGDVTVNTSRDMLSFIVINVGDDILTGEVTGLTAPFSCVFGCSYSLDPGASQIVTIRFAPTVVGRSSLMVYFSGGVGGRGAVFGKGVAFPILPGPPIPVIDVTPTSYDFGVIIVNTFADQRFTVRNIGESILTGSAIVPAPFSCHANCAYNIPAGGAHVVTVRFAPTATGTALHTVTFTGGKGASRRVGGIGVAYRIPTIEVTPASLDFGEVAVNTNRDMTFTVTNLGSGTLEGRVANLTTPFSCVAGCSYSLIAGRFQTITIRFVPIEVKNFSGRVYFSVLDDDGTSRTVFGRSVVLPIPPVHLTPAIEVTPTSLDFNSVTIGHSRDRTFTVRNTGGGTLVGIVDVSGAPFSCVDGCSYSITAGVTHTVVIRFTPSVTGRVFQTVSFMGSAEADRAVSGRGCIWWGWWCGW